MKNIWGVEKFDLILGNPPYNDGSGNMGSSHTLWDKFVIKSFDILKKEQYLVFVHPDGWRNLGNGFDKVKNLLKTKQMLYLEIHDKGDGIKTFGASTTYDFYCVKNNDQINFNTKIKCIDNTVENINISKLNFIPNGMYDSFQKLIAKNGEETVNVVRSCTYHTQKNYISKEKNDIFKYPCVYVTYKDGSIQFRYSSINNKGHFGIPKVIWSNGISTPIVDMNGEYGMTEFSYAIFDDVENLEKIKKAMLNPEFIKLMSFSDGMTGHRYNYKAISLFRKDFWKEFINEENK